MAVRIVKTIIRGCGKRKPGGCYLVSETSPDGQLDPFTILKTAIPFRPPPGVNPNMRGYILVDLNKILEGASYDEYVLGGTAERRSKEIARQPEIEAFGMPIAEREAIGICRAHGLSALAQLHPQSAGRIGRPLRLLAGATNALSESERAKAVASAQKGDWAGVLAALWRMYKNLSPRSRTSQNIGNIALAMAGIGAGEDAAVILAKEVQ